MKIWKRIGAMAMVTAFSALALTGCGGGSSSGGGEYRLCKPCRYRRILHGS